MSEINPEIPTIDYTQILAALQQIQQENLELRAQIEQIRSQSQSSTQPVTQLVGLPTEKPLEPKVCLPEKFDGNKKNFRGFLNQVRLIFQMQPIRYSDDIKKIGFISTLLSGMALAWFAPLVEKNSPLLRNYDAFITEFENAFDEHDRAYASANKIRILKQGNRSATSYVAEFRQIASNLLWNEDALMSQFRSGLQGDVKDLLLTMPDPCNLNEMMTQAIRCDNRLFERRLERKNKSPGPQKSNILNKTLNQVVPKRQFLGEPMQLDAGKLTLEERKRRQTNNLCMYCGRPGHYAKNCREKHVPGKLLAVHFQEQEQHTDSENTEDITENSGNSDA